MKQMTREQAVAFGESKRWEELDYFERAMLQIEQHRLCIPFDIFHEAIEKALGRPVFTHEFSHREALRAELLKALVRGDRGALTARKECDCSHHGRERAMTEPMEKKADGHDLAKVLRDAAWWMSIMV